MLELLRNGNTKAHEQLYNRYHPRLLRYCVRLLKERERAEDIVQNVFLKLHSNKHTIHHGYSLQSWLFTVARNEAFAILQKNRPLPLDESIVWEGETPVEQLLSKERKFVIDHVLESLSAPYREVIFLREYEHFSYAEIASMTETSVSSVKSRLFKARKALIEKLKPYFHERNI